MNPDNTLIAYRLAWAKCALMAFVGGATAFATSMSGVRWADLDGTDRALVIIGCLIAIATVVIAFLDRTISKIETERAGIPGTKEHQIATGTGDGSITPPP